MHCTVDAATYAANPTLVKDLGDFSNRFNIMFAPSLAGRHGKQVNTLEGVKQTQDKIELFKYLQDIKAAPESRILTDEGFCMEDAEMFNSGQLIGVSYDGTQTISPYNNQEELIQKLLKTREGFFHGIHPDMEQEVFVGKAGKGSFVAPYQQKISVMEDGTEELLFGILDDLDLDFSNFKLAYDPIKDRVVVTDISVSFSKPMMPHIIKLLRTLDSKL